jgi:hypothetical protein
MWYRFSYDNIDQINDINYKKIINKIELLFPYIKTKNFMSWDNFFNNFIKIEHINRDIIDISIDNDLKSFLFDLIHFEPCNRPNLDLLLKHKFISN